MSFKSTRVESIRDANREHNETAPGYRKRSIKPKKIKRALVGKIDRIINRRMKSSLAHYEDGHTMPRRLRR